MSIPYTQKGCELVGLRNVNEYNCLSAQRTGFLGTLRSGEVLCDLSAKECPWQPALGFLGDTGDWLEANAEVHWNGVQERTMPRSLHGDRLGQTCPSHGKFPQSVQHTHPCWESCEWSCVLALISVKQNLMTMNVSRRSPWSCYWSIPWECSNNKKGKLVASVLNKTHHCSLDSNAYYLV